MDRSYARPKAETISELARHGLPEAVDLVEAIAAGNDAAERSTDNDVATLAGYLRWAVPLRYLGDEYVRKQWKRKHSSCYERLVSPDGKEEIIVAQGDSATGTEKMPWTLIDRGPLTRQAVEGNRDQMRFPAIHPEFAVDPRPDVRTWMLLHFFDRDLNEIRVELSVPVEFTKCRGEYGQKNRGHITKFEPRIILPTIKLTPEASIDDEPASEPIDVPVTRRR